MLCFGPRRPASSLARAPACWVSASPAPPSFVSYSVTTMAEFRDVPEDSQPTTPIGPGVLAIADMNPESAAAVFKTTMENDFFQVVKEKGGPRQYLLSTLPDLDAMNDFAKHLWDEYPESQDVFYTTIADMPFCKTEAECGTCAPLPFHLNAFGYTQSSSLKPPCGMRKFSLLMDQIMSDGFVTSSQPLLVTTPPHVVQGPPLVVHWSGNLGTATLAYSKGAARTQTILALLRWCQLNNCSVRHGHPTLYGTLLVIFAHKIECATRLDEALLNMKLSVRGSIRTANNVIETVMMIRNLEMMGASDIAGFVRKWNAQSGKLAAITGKRAACLKLLFDVSGTAGLTTGLSIIDDEGVLEKILRHVDAIRFAQQYSMLNDTVRLMPRPFIDGHVEHCNVDIPFGVHIPVSFKERQVRESSAVGMMTLYYSLSTESHTRDDRANE